MIIYIVILTYLLVMSIFDIKDKKVPVWGLILGTVIIVVWLLAESITNGYLYKSAGRKYFLGEIGLGLFPGWILVVLCLLTKKVGLADGILLCQLGMVLGLWESMKIMFWSLTIMAAVCAVWMVLGKCRKDSKVPFLPFLFGGYMIYMLCLWMKI